MDSILHYTSVSHAGSLLASVNKLRVSTDFCDVTVVVGDYRILAHRIILSASSPFFSQMLKEGAPRSPNEISLDSVDVIAALKIIDFCYTSAISLDDDSAWQLLEAAIKFQFSEISSLCCEYLTAGLDPSNCLLFLRLAAKLRFPLLEENCVHYLVDNLAKTLKSQDLMRLSFHELSSTLSVLEFRGGSVSVMTALVQAWLDVDVKARTGYISKLKMDFPSINSLSYDDASLRDAGIYTSVAIPKFAAGTVNSCSYARELESSSVAINTQASVPRYDKIDGIGDSPFKPRIGDDADKPDQEMSVFKSREFICVSCGDEFECMFDLTAHSRLCNESVRLVNNNRSNDKNENVKYASMSSNSNAASYTKLYSNNESSSSDSKNENKEMGDSKKVIGEDKTNDGAPTHDNFGEESESYPKTRRSLRNRRIEEIASRASKKPAEVCSVESSAVGCNEETNAVLKSKSDTDKMHDEEMPDVDGNKVTESATAAVTVSSQSVDNCFTPNDSRLRLTDESISDSPLAGTNDSNNNDIAQSTSSVQGHQSASSLVPEDEEEIDVCNESPELISSEKPRPWDDVGSGNKGLADSLTTASESKAFSTLKQWRHEHQASSPTPAHAEPTPRLKCIICTQRFWDQKSLANHWRENHGVSSIATKDEDLSCSDHESEVKYPDSIKKKNFNMIEPARSLPQNMPYLSEYLSNSNTSSNAVKTKDLNPSAPNYIHCTSSDIPERHAFQPKVKQEEVPEIKTHHFTQAPDSSLLNDHNLNLPKHDTDHLKRVTDVSTGFQGPYESSMRDTPNQPIGPTADQWMRGPYWPMENFDKTSQGDADGLAESGNVPKNLQGMNPMASEFFVNYINQYNKLAGWCIAQGAQFCPMCMGYHSPNKQCPKASMMNPTAVIPSNGNEETSGRRSIPSNNSNTSNSTITTNTSHSVKESLADAKVTKFEAEDTPLDMSKSSADYSFGSQMMTPSNSSSSKSSSINSSGGHSGVLGGSALPFFNFSHLLPESSNVLDMSANNSRLGSNGKQATPQQHCDLPMPLHHQKSPMMPANLASYGSPFPSPFHHPQFSTTPLHPSPLSASTAGPSSGMPPNSTSTPLPKSGATGQSRKKVSSRQGFTCTVCNRVFSYRTALFTHMQTHSPSARTYRCQLCNESFARAPDLKVHVCPNGLEKPYSCPSCGQTFAKNIHLKRHLATHSGIKPYPCWVCGKRFSRSDHLKRHTQSIHAGARPHACQVCGKEFVRKYELNKHMQTHEPPFSVAAVST